MTIEIAYSNLIFSQKHIDTLDGHFNGNVNFININSEDFYNKDQTITKAFVDLATAKRLSKNIDIRIHSERFYDYCFQSYVFGEEHFLNYEFLIIPAFHLEKCLRLLGGEKGLFCKPVKLVKSFGGMVIKDALDIKSILELTNTSAEDKIVVSKPKEIIRGSEVRFFVSDGKIVDYSPLPEPLGSDDSIRDGRAIDYAMKIIPDADCIDQRIELYNLGEYVLDICRTSEGFKVVEINCYYTSGLYGCDPTKIVTESIRR